MPEFEAFDLPDFDADDEPARDWDPCWELDDDEPRGSTALSSEPRERKWLLLGTGLSGLATAAVVTWLTAAPQPDAPAPEAAIAERGAPTTAVAEEPTPTSMPAPARTELGEELDGLNLASAIQEPATPRHFRAPPPPEVAPAVAPEVAPEISPTPASTPVTPAKTVKVAPSKPAPKTTSEPERAPEPAPIPEAAPSPEAAPARVSLDALPSPEDLPERAPPVDRGEDPPRLGAGLEVRAGVVGVGHRRRDRRGVRGGRHHRTFTRASSRPLVSTTWTPHAMHGSNECTVRRISSGCSGSTTGVPSSALS